MEDALGTVESVLVLGAGSEIARATTRELAARGARRFVLAGRPSTALTAHADDLAQIGADSETLRFDATDLDSHEGFAADAFKRLGDFDIVLAAFGVLGDTPAELEDSRRAVDLIRTNFLGAVSVLIPVAQQMRNQGHGTLVVLSTVAAERPRKSNFVYGSSKAGLDAFAQGLGDSLMGSGVKVMVVRPGFVRTRMTEHLDEAPMAVDADDVAAAICDGLSENKEIVWVPSRIRWVMSVLRHLPRAVFRRLPI